LLGYPTQKTGSLEGEAQCFTTHSVAYPTPTSRVFHSREQLQEKVMSH